MAAPVIMEVVVQLLVFDGTGNPSVVKRLLKPCKQFQILKTKIKVTTPRPRPLLTRPRPPEVNKGTSQI